MRFEQERPETLWVGRREGTETVWRDPLALRPEAARLATTPAGHAQGYTDCFEASVLPWFADGARSARIVDAVMASARAGAAWVEV